MTLMLLFTRKAQTPVGRELLDDQEDRHDLVQRSYGADFWPMTFILIVIVVASLTALSRIAALF
jgi:hypothetical protein